MHYSYHIDDTKNYILYYLEQPLIKLELEHLHDGIYCFDLLSGEIDVLSGPVILDLAKKTDNGFSEIGFLLQKLPLFTKKNTKIMITDSFKPSKHPQK